MSQSYGPADREESIATIRQALALGINLIDTANIYGDGENERLVAEAIRGHREEVFIATKFGLVRNRDSNRVIIDGRPEHVRNECEASLSRLGVNHIDLYYQHRVAHDIPIEETIGAMGELVSQGKVRYLGLSEASAESLRRASAVHSITALQSEWSLWSRDIELEIIPTCRELNIAIIPYGPIGRGFLSGHLSDIRELANHDIRRRQPRFQALNFIKNLQLAEALARVAALKDCTPSQLALSWLHHQGDDVIPIPGTTKRSHLDENVRSLNIVLSREELAEIETIFPVGIASGQRYPDMSFVYR